MELHTGALIGAGLACVGAGLSAVEYGIIFTTTTREKIQRTGLMLTAGFGIACLIAALWMIFFN